VVVRYCSLVTDSARWDGFEFRADDIIISTPPKCGTTWTQMICALLIFQTPTFEQPLSITSPWLDMLTRPRAEVFADLEAQTHRRFIKTHTPLDGLPWDERVTYIDVGRDPRDVALSMAHHMTNMNFDNLFGALATTATADGGADPFAPSPDAEGEADSPLAEFPAELSDRDRFFLWVDNPTPPTEETSSLLRTLKHHETFWNERTADNVVLLHYDDLKTDLEGEMRALATRLGIEVPEDRWPELVDAATFEQMRGNAERVAPNTDGAFWTSTEDFFHRGTSGQWRSLLDDDDLRRYETRVARLVAPDLAAWIHHRP
jgi:aryl sulfotransferase